MSTATNGQGHVQRNSVTTPIIRKLTTDKAVKAAKVASADEVTHANLAGRGIKTIESLELPSLRRLDLSKNSLNRLKGLQTCTQVTYLTAAANELTGEGLDGVRPLRDLKVFNVSSNRVRKIPPSVFAQFRQLQALVLNNNEISEVPPSWLKKGLYSLNTLVLSHNKVKSLSNSGIGRLTALTKLSVSHNVLSELPDLSASSGLEELRAAHNRIAQVPASLAKNTALRTVDLGHNRIDEWDGLERAGEGLRSLVQLTLAGNPLCGERLSGDDAEANIEANSYVTKVRSLFPGLKVRDGKRVLMKKSHVYYEQPSADADARGGGTGGDQPGGKSRTKAKTDARDKKAQRQENRKLREEQAEATEKGDSGRGEGASNQAWRDGDGGVKESEGLESAEAAGGIGKKEKASKKKQKGDKRVKDGRGERSIHDQEDLVHVEQTHTEPKKIGDGSYARPPELDAAVPDAGQGQQKQLSNKAATKKRRRREKQEPDSDGHGEDTDRGNTPRARERGRADTPAVDVGDERAEQTPAKKQKRRDKVARVLPKRLEGAPADGVSSDSGGNAIGDPYSSSEELQTLGRQNRGPRRSANGSGKPMADGISEGRKTGTKADQESGVVAVVVNKRRKEGKRIAAAGKGSSPIREKEFSVTAMIEARGLTETLGSGSRESSWD